MYSYCVAFENFTSWAAVISNWYYCNKYNITTSRPQIYNISCTIYKMMF